MTNSTNNVTTTGLPGTGLDITDNLTVYETLSQFLFAMWNNRDMLMLEGRIVGTALACIYLGSHAALRRPPSARSPKKGKDGGNEANDEAENDFVQGMSPQDVIIFPVLAGTVLVGLYYLIKWLEDPAIINKVLGIYFSIMGLASMGKLIADGLHFLTSLVFPDVWTAADGTVYHFDNSKKSQYRLSESGERVFDGVNKSPLPGSRWSGFILSDPTRHRLWETRHLLQEHWTVRIALHGVGKEQFRVKLIDIVAAFLAIGANSTHYATGSTFITNVMGCAFSYTSIIMMSPTTFTTGSGVLFALFFYDIYMVFYTPYMVTVATKLDIPIKLTFQGPTRASILGLGDIVIPGMFVALCLRFDHFLHYHRQRRLVPVELNTTREDEVSGETVTSKMTQRIVVKPEYVNPQGQWGNRFWTSALPFFTHNLATESDATLALKASMFPKTYFHAALVGYFIAMLTTLSVLMIYKHAQPALLYLVPGVVFSVWLMGLVRGEIKEMWTYTEDGSLDKVDVVVEVDADGHIVKDIAGKDDKEKDTEAILDSKAEFEDNTEEKENPNVAKRRSREKYVFSFIIEAPASLVEEGKE